MQRERGAYWRVQSASFQRGLVEGWFNWADAVCLTRSDRLGQTDFNGQSVLRPKASSTSSSLRSGTFDKISAAAV